MPFGGFERHGGAFVLLGLVTGAMAWVGICVGAGYLFGNVPLVKDNFSLVALGIVFVSLLPMAFELLTSRRARSSVERGL